MFKKKEQYSAKDAVLEAIEQAQDELKMAKQHFFYATESAYIDIAIEEIAIAEKKLDLCFKKARLLEDKEPTF